MDLGLSEKLLGVRDKIEDFVFNKVEPVESDIMQKLVLVTDGLIQNGKRRF